MNDSLRSCTPNFSNCSTIKSVCTFDNLRMGTRLRYGDIIKIQLNEGGNTVPQGLKIGYLGDTNTLVAREPISFIVLCPLSLRATGRVLDRNDEFLLVEKDGSRMLCNDNGYVSLKQATLKRAHDSRNRLSAFDRTNVRGGITARVAPIYGNNYFYFNDNGVAKIWVWLDDRIVLREHMYFSFPHPNHCVLTHLCQLRVIP